MAKFKVGDLVRFKNGTGILGRVVGFKDHVFDTQVQWLGSIPRYKMYYKSNQLVKCSKLEHLIYG